MALAREALRAVLAVRRKAGISKTNPVCVFDLAQQLDVEVMFTHGNSFEGLYARESSTIVVSALRPPGRQAYTCAHELAHWKFDHGTRVDELDTLTNPNSPEERLANLFAGYLLMPPLAVKEAYGRRSWNPDAADPVQTYTIACQLGVGYETLIQQLRCSLGLITERRAQQLLRHSPKSIRMDVLGEHSSAQHLVVVDSHWGKVPIDLRVGDTVALPETWEAVGSVLTDGPHPKNGRAFIAAAPGIGQIVSGDGVNALFVRVSRKEYEGRCKYRHLEEPDDV